MSKRHSKRHCSKRQCRFELDKKLNTVDNSGGNGYNYVVYVSFIDVVYKPKCRLEMSF